MNRDATLLGGLAAVALGVLVAAAAPAQAQSRRGYSGRPGTQYPYGQNGQQIQVLPPEPLGPMSLGILERDFQYMRANGPLVDKNQFLYGRWNPRYQVVNPPPTYVPPAPGYYPQYPYYPYQGGVYGSIGFPNGYIGFGIPGQSNVVQREYVIIREGSGNPQAPAPAPKPEARPERRPDEEFYLRGKSPEPAASETISDALDDVRKAWLNGDFERLRARFKADAKVRIYLRGQFRYAVDAKEFTGMLRDAMARIDTAAFEFDRPRPLEGGRVFVSGKHTFFDADKSRRETYVSYGLERVEGRWKIVEAGSSSAPVTGHDDTAPAETQEKTPASAVRPAEPQEAPQAKDPAPAR